MKNITEKIKSDNEKIEKIAKLENHVLVFTDGSCNYKTQKGGIGIYMKFNNYEKRISEGSFIEATTGRMELLAMIVALKTVRKDLETSIFSDSMYVVNCCNLWVKDWYESKMIEFKKNTDLLLLLHSELIKINPNLLKIAHVKGHSGVDGNEIADRLADKGYRSKENKNISEYIKNFK